MKIEELKIQTLQRLNWAEHIIVGSLEHKFIVDVMYQCNFAGKLLVTLRKLSDEHYVVSIRDADDFILQNWSNSLEYARSIFQQVNYLDHAELRKLGFN
jgi:hypothetical protein